MSHKFLNLIESTIQKMTNGGILVGDRVSLVSGYKSKDSFKGLSDDVKKYIEDNRHTLTEDTAPKVAAR